MKCGHGWIQPSQDLTKNKDYQDFTIQYPTLKKFTKIRLDTKWIMTGFVEIWLAQDGFNKVQIQSRSKSDFNDAGSQSNLALAFNLKFSNTFWTTAKKSEFVSASSYKYHTITGWNSKTELCNFLPHNQSFVLRSLRETQPMFWYDMQTNVQCVIHFPQPWYDRKH